MNDDAAPLTDFHVAKATIGSAKLDGRIGVDEGAAIRYQEARGFELVSWFLPDPHGPPSRVRSLGDADLLVLRDQIRTVLADPPAGLDVNALEAFDDIIEGVLHPVQNLFAHAKFGQAVEEIFGGTKTIIGHVGLGIDVVATIHDTAGIVTWEHHIVPLPPGPPRPLTSSERESLASALGEWLDGQQDGGGWREILDDLKK